jgi:superfamily II RNA helicase
MIKQPSAVLRKMMTEVIAKCKNGGLHVLVTARDGQWHVYEMRDNEGHALTKQQSEADLMLSEAIFSHELEGLVTKTVVHILQCC